MIKRIIKEQKIKYVFCLNDGDGQRYLGKDDWGVYLNEENIKKKNIYLFDSKDEALDNYWVVEKGIKLIEEEFGSLEKGGWENKDDVYYVEEIIIGEKEYEEIIDDDNYFGK